MSFNEGPRCRDGYYRMDFPEGFSSIPEHDIGPGSGGGFGEVSGHFLSLESHVVQCNLPRAQAAKEETAEIPLQRPSCGRKVTKY